MEDLIIEFFATFLIWILFAGLIILWFIDGKIKKEQVIHALLAVTISYFIAFLVKKFFPTIRPFVANGREVDVLLMPHDGAFPSEHSTIAFALAVTIFMHDRKIGSIFLVSAILIGISRVLANVHYPIDILGGALLGTLVAIVIEKTHMFNFLGKKGLTVSKH